MEMVWSVLSLYPVTEETYKNCDKPPFVNAVSELKNKMPDHLDVKCECLLLQEAGCPYVDQVPENPSVG